MIKLLGTRLRAALLLLALLIVLIPLLFKRFESFEAISSSVRNNLELLFYYQLQGHYVEDVVVYDQDRAFLA